MDLQVCALEQAQFTPQTLADPEPAARLPVHLYTGWVDDHTSSAWTQPHSLTTPAPLDVGGWCSGRESSDTRSCEGRPCQDEV